ncbi:MAG: SPOR domain-containing protein [Saprospiraceae bacterium]|nr:SPOR domain-containing protein [Saprospiraceae bacterium]
MGRLVRIAIYALVILILYFWATAMLKSYYKNKKLAQLELMTKDTIDLDSTLIDTSFQDTTASDQKLITNDEIVSKGIDYNDVDSKVDAIEIQKKAEPKTPAQKPKDKVKLTQNTGTKEPPSKNKTTPAKESPTVSKNITGDGGSYLVMAGSYLLKENANKMVKKLNKLGYANAEVIIFPQSEYHSVIAVKYSSESKAKEAADMLRQKGIDCFVKH